jgi:impB/mucB/samB family C-terminal domain
VARLAGTVAAELAGAEPEPGADGPRPAIRVVVKVRYAPFITETHGQPLAGPTVDAEPIRAAALAALGRFTGRRPVRLLGVRAEFASLSLPDRCPLRCTFSRRCDDNCLLGGGNRVTFPWSIGPAAPLGAGK